MTKIILFGDSITAGYSKGKVTDQLTRRIKASFPAADVVNAGIPGETTREALLRVSRDVLQYTPDVVTLFFGANDVAENRHLSLADYEANLKQLISLIGPKRTVLVTGPYTNQQEQGKQRPLSRIEAYVESALRIGKDSLCTTVPLYEMMQRSGRPDEWLQSDGLHFSEAGYTQLAALMTEAIRKTMKGRER